MANQETPLPELTDEQRQLIAVNYLHSLAETEPEQLPYDIFVPIAKLMVLNTAEVAFVKPSPTDGRRAQVLLTQRPETDQFWANQWHIPGSIVRATDPVTHEHDYDAAVTRVRDEVGGNIEGIRGVLAMLGLRRGVRLVNYPVEYDIVRRKGLRGSETTVRLMAESKGKPTRGAFFDAQTVLKNPPEGGLIDSHAEAIEKLAARYHDLKTR
jgi:hypothetical protein